MQVTHSVIKQLLAHYKEISLLAKIKALLDWDLNVNLPSKAAEGRAAQTGYLANQITKLWLDKDFRTNLIKANKITRLTTEEKAILRNLNYGGKYYFTIPPEIIEQKETVSSKAFMAWRKAREKNEYKLFLPLLKELIEIEQIMAKHIGYKENPYDALLDLHEPGLTATYCEKIFNDLKPELIALVKNLQKTKRPSPEKTLIEGKYLYPSENQKNLGIAVMKNMGFDFEAGRADISAHPFTTTLGQEDTRITSFSHEKDFRSSYLAYVHETGHALYEQGIDPQYSETPLEGGVSFGIHEALSRFWENMVGRNPNFLRFMTPVFQQYYPKQLQNVTEQELIQLFSLIKPSFIRIEADEITYTLHIILRFEMENALINGTIKPEDAPDVWRKKSQEYLGIVPPTDSEGILQDVHWSYGAFGYFPSYALGNLYGAQFLHTMKKSFAFEKELAKGKLKKVHTWLNQMIHHHGSLYLPPELLQKATGEELNPKYFITYLTEKYLPLNS